MAKQPTYLVWHYHDKGIIRHYLIIPTSDGVQGHVMDETAYQKYLTIQNNGGNKNG